MAAKNTPATNKTEGKEETSPEIVDENNPAEEGPDSGAPALTIQDLQTLAQAIDLASQRGAYRASEMGDVGTVYSKLTGFLQALAQQQQSTQGGNNG